MKAFTIITGILTVILGFFAMFMPLRVFLGLGWLLGVLFMLNGVEMSIEAFAKKKNVWQGILGILVAISGIILLSNGIMRFFTDVMVTYFVGGSIIVSGMYLIINGMHSFKESKGRGVLNILCGVLEIILGIAAVMHPILTMISVGYLIAANLIMQGIGIMALASGKVSKENQAAPASEDNG